MPENNLMKSVLTNATWPEQDGYRHHSDEPVLSADISTERIDDDMGAWLAAWAEATQ